MCIMKEGKLNCALRGGKEHNHSFEKKNVSAPTKEKWREATAKNTKMASNSLGSMPLPGKRKREKSV